MSLPLNKLVEESHENLRHSPVGFEYLTKSRHFSVETIKRELMGFCNREIASSFVSELDDPRWIHDKSYYEKMLVGRVLLPIRDDLGKIVAIATREPDKNVKGWWNSPFDKENVLYGMHYARGVAFAKNKIYVVEGYADVISLWQAGLRNVVGMMGTVITRIQHGIILRYCSNMCACFDTDPERNGKAGGGQLGLERMAKECMRRGYYDSVHAIVMPMGKDANGNDVGADPDDFVRKNGLKPYLDLERRILMY